MTITVILEFLATKEGCDPCELVRTFDIVDYVIDAPEKFEGKPILALEETSPGSTYILHRLADLTNPKLVAGAQRQVFCSAFKLRWDELEGEFASVTAFYRILGTAQDRPEPLINEVPFDREWTYVLKQTEPASGKYRLVRVLRDEAPSLHPCVRLKNAGIDCAHPADENERETCLSKHC